MSRLNLRSAMLSFNEELQRQRWDDHRFYHQSRINQSLHLLSACTFIVAYVMLFIDPARAAILGWLVAMILRQTGHFFFEPTSFDHINQASHEYKESIKTGYNLTRKIILHSLWFVIPFLIWLSPTCLDLLPPYDGLSGLIDRIGFAWLWFAALALLTRTIFLALTQNWMTGFAWFTKIITDPFHDIKMYYKSPIYLLQGQKLDPMTHVTRCPIEM